MNITKLHNKTSIAFFVFYFLMLSVIKSIASGWAVDSYSAKSLSTSNASSSTDLNNVSNSVVNPAIISGVKKNQFSISGSYLGVQAEYTTTTENGDAGVDVIIPSISYAKKITDDINVGLSISVPYGLATEYDKNWSGKSQAIKSEVEAILFNPIVSYNINKNLSFAFGAKVQQFSTRLTKNVGVAVDLKAKDWGYGFNSGLIYKINQNLNLGLSYNSKIRHKINKGDLELGANSASDVKFDITMPESVNLGLSYDLTEATRLFYGVSWTRWSRLKEIVVSSNILSAPDILSLNWTDSFKNAIGVDHKINQKYSIRGGLAYETAAVDSDREPITPSNDKYWASLGTEYNINQNSAVNLSYVHQFFRSGRIPSLAAEYDIAVNIFAIGYKLNF